LAYQRGVFWGVVPYTPAAPFSVKFMHKYEDVETIGDLSRQFRDQDIAGEVPFSVLGKLRPILAISEPSLILRDLMALRLVNVTRRARQRHMTQEDERAVLAGEHPYLVPLRQEVVSTLTRTGERYAVSIDPVTLHQSAVGTRVIGEITPEEFAVVCHRFIDVLHLDLTVALDERSAGGDGRAEA
jgi:hypothetical protein